MELLDYRTQIKNRTYISVKDFPYGAESNPSVDVSSIIYQAIQDSPEGAEIIIPQGIFYINSKIVGKSKTALRGSLSWMNYSSNPFSYNASRLVCALGFSDDCMLDFRGTIGNISIKDLTLIGNGTQPAEPNIYSNTDATVIGMAFGTYDQPNGTLCQRITVESCNICLCRVGLGFKQANYLQVRNNNIGNMSFAGIHCDNFSGNDSTFENNYINLCNRLLANIGDPTADIYTGSAMIFTEGSGGVKIIGGKLEWNANGIVLGEWSQQVHISGVTFDANSKYHIRARSNTGANHSSFYNPATFRGGSVHHRVEQCMFLNGGYLPAVSATPCMIFLDGQSTDANAYIQIAINDNTFWTTDVTGAPQYFAGADSFYMGGPRYPAKWIIGRGSGGTRLFAQIQGNDVLWFGTSGNPEIDIPAGAFTANSIIIQSANAGTIVWNVDVGVVNNGPLFMDFGTFIQVNPASPGFINHDLIGTGFDTESLTQIKVPGSVTTGRPLITLRGNSETTNIGAGTTGGNGTLYIRDDGTGKITSVRIINGTNQANNALLLVGPKVLFLPDGTIAGDILQFFTNGNKILSGNGAPGGVISAPVGSLYLNIAGGASTTLYVKESGGSGNTGWVGK